MTSSMQASLGFFTKGSSWAMPCCHSHFVLKLLTRWASSLVVGIAYQEMNLIGFSSSKFFVVAESGAGAVTGSGIAAAWLNR